MCCPQQLLLVWDEGEVRKIVHAAQWALDRLELVLGSKSMRGLVVCFGVSCPFLSTHSRLPLLSHTGIL